MSGTNETQGSSVIPIIQIPNAGQQNFPPRNDECQPLCDPEYLYQNNRCFQYLRDISTPAVKQKKKNDTFQYTSQFLYGCYMPPYYSVLDFKLMDRFVKHIKWPKGHTIPSLLKHKELIAHERELFGIWLSKTWEEHLKSRRVNVIPFIQDYIKTACNISNGFIKSHYNGTYISKMVIKYNQENDKITNKIELDHCQRIKSSEITCRLNLPQVDITDLESKVSFADGIYILPQKSPFVKDELCQTLSKEHGTDVNMCLSSLKSIMNLEKSNSLWLIPVNILIDTDKRKTINIGGSLSTGHFSQQEKSLYYLRKELKKKFIKDLSKTIDNVTIQNKSKYNYDKWMLKVNDMNGEVIKSYNLLIRNKPHVQGDNNTYKTNTETTEKVLIPKIEYQPEFGFEKISEEQLSEYWLNTYFRSPRCCSFLVSVQYNMDIMMCKTMNSITKTFISDEKKQMHFQRLYQTFDKLAQLGVGEYFMLHNPKNPFEVNLYQSSKYGGFNLFNMYFVLQQTEVLDSMTWNPIEPDVLCPIHEHFKVAPCMFRPNPTLLNVQMISDQVDKFKKVKEMQEKIEKEQAAKRKRAKHEKNKIKRQSKKDNDSLIQMKRETMKNL